MTPRPAVGDLEPTEAEHRRAARERALELLYEAEAKGAPVGDVLGGLPVPPDPLAVELAEGVDAHRDRIDTVLTRLVAPRWSLERLAAVDRAVLRIGAYELFAVAERSQALVINEAVVLARKFGTDDSPRFVNGVLSAVAAEARPPGGGATPEEDAAAGGGAAGGRSAAPPGGAAGDHRGEAARGEPARDEPAGGEVAPADEDGAPRREDR